MLATNTTFSTQNPAKKWNSTDLIQITFIALFRSTRSMQNPRWNLDAQMNELNMTRQ